MAEREIHEMISAYAAGCMDRENFINFKSYILKGNDLPYRELGELQNIVALLPVMLEKETPPEFIKSKLLEKISKGEKENAGENKEEAVEEIPDEETEVKNIESEPIDYKNITEEISDDEIDAPKLSFTKVPQPVNESVSEKGLTGFFKLIEFDSLIRSKETIRLVIIAATFLVISVIIFYLLNNRLTSRLDKMQDKITQLTTEAAQSKEFIKEYNIFINFFNYKDIRTITLSGTETNPDRNGKIFIAPEKKEGLLELANIPALPDDQTYQVWAFIGEDTYSLGTFTPETGKRYYRLPDIPQFDLKRTGKIIITNEPVPGSLIPEGTEFYSSSE